MSRHVYHFRSSRTVRYMDREVTLEARAECRSSIPFWSRHQASHGHALMEVLRWECSADLDEQERKLKGEPDKAAPPVLPPRHSGRDPHPNEPVYHRP